MLLKTKSANSNLAYLSLRALGILMIGSVAGGELFSVPVCCVRLVEYLTLYQLLFSFGEQRRGRVKRSR